MNDQPRAGAIPPQLVWDWPLRLFHWLLVLAIAFLFFTGKLGGNWMEWHKRAGFVVIGLLAFRLVWGFAGGYHARFVNFVRGPRTVWNYLAGKFSAGAGHNPLGALSVLAMLALLALQAGTGLFSNDDIVLEGPYAGVVGKEMSDWLTRVHKINSNVLLGLIALHLAAIAWYFFKRKVNLVLPMITGRKLLNAEISQATPSTWKAIVLMASVAAGIYGLFGR